MRPLAAGGVRAARERAMERTARAASKATASERQVCASRALSTAALSAENSPAFQTENSTLAPTSPRNSIQPLPVIPFLNVTSVTLAAKGSWNP
jgi:hypothetical protein